MSEAIVRISRTQAGDFMAYLVAPVDAKGGGVAGFGGSPSEALRALAFEIETEGRRSQIPAVQKVYKL